MKFAVADIEATGLDVDTVSMHCLVVQTENNVADFGPDQLEEGIEYLQQLVTEGYILTGHNFLKYDLPILRRYGLEYDGWVYDTLIVSRAAYPGNDLFVRDSKKKRKSPSLADAYRSGGHGLREWGFRLDNHKGDYDGGWDKWSQEMHDYCIQDVALNWDVLRKLRERMPDAAAELECRVQGICYEMNRDGVEFDVLKAQQFAVELAQRRGEIALELKDAFPDWVVSAGTTVPKRTQKRKHNELIDGKIVVVSNTFEGVAYERPKVVTFNPASTQHIVYGLQQKYGWKPTKYTDKGTAQCTAEILRELPYPEAQLLAEYQEVKKILGYLAEGKGAWLKLEKNGRIHGSIAATGTVSGRAAHTAPNLGNVPARSDYGHRCRGLFVAAPGRVIVGADASGLQLRALGHYLGKWDERRFAEQCETGDIHEYMRAATKLFTRDNQKTWTYAKLFGAGAGLLGRTCIKDHAAALAQGLTSDPVPKQTKAGALGRRSLANLGDAIPAMGELEVQLAAAADAGFLRTLDGRRIPVTSGHTAIAMLLQGFEAIVMKRAMVMVANALACFDAKLVLWVHDEFQVECLPEDAEEIGSMMVEAIRQTGVFLDLRVALDGEYKVGPTWADTH